MRLTIATWNINSVRLRLNGVARLIKLVQPDVLCLQETKCPDDAFPVKRFKRLGYEHIALNGQKGYHGVATISRLPFERTELFKFCDRIDSRHVSVTFGERAGLTTPLRVDNYYVPAGGDVPDPKINPKFEHKLSFLGEMHARNEIHPADGEHRVLVGDLNVAPHEHDVWSHKQLVGVVSHTPIECDKLLAIKSRGGWLDLARSRIPEPEKVYTWWSYRAADWKLSDRGRRLDHIWVSSRLAPSLQDFQILRDARGWPRPSDHVPVICSLEL